MLNVSAPDHSQYEYRYNNLEQVCSAQHPVISTTSCNSLVVMNSRMNLREQGTRDKQGDKGTRGQGDMGTREQEDKGTSKGTREQGDKEVFKKEDRISPSERHQHKTGT